MKEDLSLNKHTSNRFNKELLDMVNMVNSMGELVIQQLKDGLKAIETLDEKTINKVISSDKYIDEIEKKIDHKCTEILVKRNPAASDLRLIISVIKITTDLERIGDEAEKIGKYANKISRKNTPNEKSNQLRHLGQHVLELIENTMKCFNKMETKTAVQLINSDKQINDEYDDIIRLFITRMMEDPREIKPFLNASWAARSLERVGDHAKNICQYIVYIVDGEDIRHQSI